MGTPAALLGLVCKLLTRVIIIIPMRPLGEPRVTAGVLVLRQGWGGVERAEDGQEAAALGWVTLTLSKRGDI